MSGRYLNLVGDNRPVTGASAPAGDPPSSAGAMLFDVDAHEVDPGDILVDAPHARVAHMLFSGCEWIYFDARRRPITSYALDARVLVVRKGVSGESAIGNDAAAWELGVSSSSDTTVSPVMASGHQLVNAGAVDMTLAPAPALIDECPPHGIGRPRARLIRGGAL